MTLYGRIRNQIHTIWSDPDSDSDPDLTKRFGSERIRIRNTGPYRCPKSLSKLKLGEGDNKKQKLKIYNRNNRDKSSKLGQPKVGLPNLDCSGTGLNQAK